MRAAAEPDSRDAGRPARRSPARRAHAPGALSELQMPLRLRPQPALPQPLPHVGRAAAAATISGPLPLLLSLTDARPRRPSPRRSAHARPAHATAGSGSRAQAARRPA